MPPRALGLAIAFVSLVGAARVARADGPYEGRWREGPLNVQVTIRSWGADCGPRPQSTTTSGGGTFEITQSGDQLVFHLRRRRSTRSCWSENRAVRRVSSTHQAGTWRILCRTPPEDSRGETGRYTIQAVGTDTLRYSEQSDYDWQLNESRCVASIRATQTFTRVSGGGGDRAGGPDPAPTRPRCTPAEAARIALRPRRAEVQPGGEQCFSAAIVDAEGCPLRGRRARLRVEGPGSIRGLCYRASDEPGQARVIATAGDLRAEARVTVRTMDLSDLIARRGETQAPDGPATEGDASSATAARVRAAEAEENPDLLWPAIAVGAALALVIIGVLILRARAKPRPMVSDFPRVRTLAKSGVSDVPDTATDAEPARPSQRPAPAEDLICPTCRRGYGPDMAKCPHDDTELVPYREFVSGGGENVCPRCGERYPKTVKFCGKDGATLESSS